MGRQRDATRLDVAMVERGLTETRAKAQAMILAGSVLVDGNVVTRAGHRVESTTSIALKARPRFVSRGGEKLQHALDTFKIEVTGLACADIGSSTGGFTDSLLQAGATRVYAIDVGYGQLDSSLRNDSRVVVMERTNARYLEALPEPIDFASTDVSFISLRLILPVIEKLLTADGSAVVLVKPQFEAGRKEVGKKGVVSDPAVHRRILADVMQWAMELGFAIGGLVRSPLKGPEGNVEFLLYLRRKGSLQADLEALIESALKDTPAGPFDGHDMGGSDAAQVTGEPTKVKKS